MAGDLNNRAEEITDVTQDSNTEIALDDLEANADINGGYTPKPTDVTLKRGLIG